MDRPDGIVDFEPSAEHFPFESRWFASSVGPIHYIDEGTGRPVVLFHGNPDWSFLYRKIVVGYGTVFVASPWITRASGCRSNQMIPMGSPQLSTPWWLANSSSISIFRTWW